MVHLATQSWGRLLIWQLSRRKSLTPFTRRVSHKHSLPYKLAVHRVLYPSMLTESWLEGKSVEEKDAQPTERTAPLWGLLSKIDSRIWVNFTRNGLRLGSRHQEPPHTDVSRNLATVVVRGVLPGLRRRRTGLLPSGPKSSFQMRASFLFHLETTVLESGGRVEKLIAQVAWSSVLSFHSLWWFGVQYHLLAFLKINVTAPVYQYILEHFMLTSADQLFKDADFIFQQDLAPAHTAKSIKSWLNDHGVGVPDWPANSPDLNPIKNLWDIVKRKMRNKRPKNADELKATVKETWASIPPQQWHKRITSMRRRIEAVIKAKGAPTLWKHTFQKANNSIKMFFFFYWSYEVF